MKEVTRRFIQRLHRKGTRSFWQACAYIVLFFSLVGAAILTWNLGWWPITILLWGLIAHVGHMNLIAFHEASHFTLHPNRLLNEGFGLVVGSIILTPLSVYRQVHNEHHKHIGGPQDTELWPFVDTRTSRGLRLLCACGELLVGFFYTPIVFLRGVLAADRLPRWQTTRIILEYALCLAWWTVTLWGVLYFGVMAEFLVGYLIPTIISGNLQSLRKFTEHMGLLGDSILTTTRSVIDHSLLGRTLSESMMHIDYHGTHHRYARIPHYSLPEATPLVFGDAEQAIPIFPTYRSAMWDMAKSLGNPRVGAQWLGPAEIATSKIPAPNLPEKIPA